MNMVNDGCAPRLTEREKNLALGAGKAPCVFLGRKKSGVSTSPVVCRAVSDIDDRNSYMYAIKQRPHHVTSI